MLHSPPIRLRDPMTERLILEFLIVQPEPSNTFVMLTPSRTFGGSMMGLPGVNKHERQHVKKNN